MEPKKRVQANRPSDNHQPQPASWCRHCYVQYLIFVHCILNFAFRSFLTIANASDPDILSDFIIQANSTVFSVTKVGVKEFPALNGQSVSLAGLQYPAEGVNLFTRASELLLVAEGSLEVGLIDSTNKLYTQTLQIGDMFVFRKELVRYQYNANAQQYAVAIIAFGSASAGTMSVPMCLPQESTTTALPRFSRPM